MSAVDRGLVLAIAARVVPPSAALDAAERESALALIEHAIAIRPRPVRRQLALFLRLVRWLPVLRYGRPFERLEAPAQDAVLRWLQQAPLVALRRGFWGLRTLMVLGYYGRPEIGEAIAYRPERDGNARLRAR
jgi:hypothetical protein